MGRHRNAYWVKYKMHFSDTERGIAVLAASKAEAYDTAVYEEIPKANDGHIPYSAWVASVTYQNGNCRQFNTCEGLGY